MATSEGIPSSIDIEFLELNDNPYSICCVLRILSLIFYQESNIALLHSCGNCDMHHGGYKMCYMVCVGTSMFLDGFAISIP